MADHRHKRDANARPEKFRMPPARYVAGPIALVATLATVGAGVVAANPETRDLLTASSGTTAAAGSISNSTVNDSADETTVDISGRTPVVSRSESRLEKLSPVDKMLTAEATTKAVRQADTKRWATTALNLWTTPDDTAEKVGLLEQRKPVLVTGRTALDRVEVVIDGDARWVTSGYLAEEKPEAEPAEMAVGGECTNGTSVPGASANIVAVHQAVCANFPEITTYGALRGDGEHAQGIAVDIMVSGARGQQVAEFVRSNFQELGVNYVIHAQQIWSVDRSSEGWRFMEDRGSVTANHYDHVHVTTY